MLYASYKKEVATSQSLNIPQDVSDRYNHTAPSFDAEVDTAEKIMRLGAKRKDLVRTARGNTLEVSCGTGRNLEYYELGERRGVDDQGHAQVRGCRSVTFVDLSSQMVDITRRKFESRYPDFRLATFRAQDAGAVEPPAAAPYYALL
jgi:methyltransferase OMS1